MPKKINPMAIMIPQTYFMDNMLQFHYNNAMESRVDRKKKEAKGRILAAAKQLFAAEHSYGETTIREIANKADVSIGTVYSHFSTKAQILSELISINTDRIKLKMQEAIPAQAAGAEQMEAFLFFFETLRRDPNIALYFRLPTLTGQPGNNAGMEQEFSGFRAILTDILRKGNADGSIRPLKDPDITATILMNITLSFIFDLEFETTPFAHIPMLHQYDSDTIFSGFYDLIRNALGIEPAAGAGRKSGAKGHVLKKKIR
ncbi:TetR/AcrR family transcriptional regulator [Leadbettera azotonutricia]|nr:TetR/AcrR family transcriptional regulator [Leadbettera azotonutricia]